MNRNNINYFFVGILVISMALVLLVVLFEITGKDENTEPYYALFNNVTNIQKGTTVTYGGFPVGYVNHIEPVRSSGRTQFNVVLALKEGWIIPSDSQAKIYTPGVLADTMIDIEEGQLLTLLKPGDSIVTRESPELMTLLGDVAEEIKTLSVERVQPLIQAMEEVTTQIGSNMNKSIQEISNETLVLLSRLDEIGASMDGNVTQVSEGTLVLLAGLEENSRELSKFMNKSNAQHLSNMLENTDRLTQELSTTISDISEAGKALNELMKEGNEIVSDNKDDIRVSVEETKNTLQTISSSVESIVFQLDNTSRNMNEFSRRIKENPSSLIQSGPLEDNAE